MPGVYISYPFCTQKCSFCNFASDVAVPDVKARYLQALASEIKTHQWLWPPETLYLGGGTPSLLAPDELACITASLPRLDLRESTMECAPGSIDEALVKSWVTLGINRVSLGVQSFITAELKQTGRRHSAATVSQDVAMLRRHGIPNINIDLIAGLPGQTVASWNESLDWIERLQPPHVSVYIFEIDDDSRLGKEALLGGVRYGADVLPSDDVTADLYERAYQRLGELGIARYEISNFALPGFESQHNLKYWKLEPYVGFGLDAHSFDGVHRWSNPDELSAYLAEREPASVVKSDLGEEHFFVGLRLSSGIQPTAEERRRFSEPIARWLQAGMLEERCGALRLSDRGVLVSNEILQEFVSV